MKKVPKLRFKEFSDEWVEKKLGEILEISTSKYNPTKEKKDYPCIELESLSQETGKILSIFNSLEQKSIKNKFNKEEVLFGKLRPYLKKYYFTKFEGVCSSEIWVFTSKINIKKFLYYFIQIEKFLTLANTTSGTKMPRADWNLMKGEDFLIPSLQEQEKIANVLSSVDKKISLIEEKLELFKKYKKGVMQKIFSQELRFKDNEGNDYPEWEEKRLGEIGEIITGKTPSTKEEKYWNGEIQFVTPTDMKGNKYQFVTQRTVTEKINIGFLSKGAIMFTCIGATIGKMSIATTLCITNQQINSIIVNEKINNEYVYYCLLNTVPKIQASKSTTTMPIINKTEFSKFEIQLPTLEEQQKIANFLSSTDTKIEKIEKELENLREFKKGLLQQMFV